MCASQISQGRFFVQQANLTLDCKRTDINWQPPTYLPPSTPSKLRADRISVPSTIWTRTHGPVCSFPSKAVFLLLLLAHHRLRSFFFTLTSGLSFFPALLFPSSCPAGGDFLLFRQLQLDRNCNCNCNPRIFLHSIRNLFHLITIRHIKRSVSRVCTPVPFCFAFAFAFDTRPTPGRYLGLVAPLPLSHHLSSRTPYPLHAQEKATRSASLGRKSPRSAQSPDELSCPHLSPSLDVRLTHSASHIPLLSSLYQHTDAHRVLLKTTQRLYLLLDTRFCIP